MRRSLSTVAMITWVMAVVGAFLGSHAPPAWACGPSITIAFHESSDGDIFIIKNNSEEAWFLASLEITLTGPSAGWYSTPKTAGRDFPCTHPSSRPTMKLV